MADFRLGRLKFNWRGDWVSSTAYVIDDIVKFGANTYVCVTNHTSVSTEVNWYSTDLTTKWSLHSEGIKNLGDWASSTFYKVNDIIKYGNTQYRVNTAFTSSGTFSATNLSPYVGGFNFESAWSSSTDYQVGDVVSYGGYNYIAKTISLNKSPSSFSADWAILSTGFSFVGSWSTTTSYLPGQVVRFGGYSYVAKNNIGIAGAGQTTSPVAVGYGTQWDLIVKGFEWKSAWSSLTTYQLGDSVSRNSNSYVSVASTNNNHPPETDSLGDYWNPLTEGAADNVLSVTGDMIYKSGAGPAALTIGTSGQVVAVSTTGIPAWEKNNVTAPVFYVTEEGKDSFNGSSISRSFASIAHAVGIVTGPATIYVKAGTYSEVLPIIIPANVTLVGDNLRTTKIKPKSGNSKTQIITLNTPLAGAISYGTTISNGAGTKVARIMDANYSKDIIEIINISGSDWNTGDTWENGATDIVINAVSTRINSETTMFYLSDKTMLKDLVMDGMTGFVPAGTVLTASGSISGTTLTSSNLFPDLVGTTVTGGGIASGTKIINFISTSQVEVNVSQTAATTTLTFTSSATDLNNATVKGVFVRLNPSSPIIKSPYVSQCSAFSSGGVGAIVDGKTHEQYDSGNYGNRSNKSIVFDSWTQVHDNGVGFWITNNGAAEIVSCFTYYCHISYASTRGGRIRSLAGNSSWGNYAIVSSGYNQNEEFISGKIEGLKLSYNVETLTAPGFVQYEKIRGATSGAQGFINSVQTGDATIYYTLITKGPNVGISSGFLQNEVIRGLTSGTLANLTNNTDANKGQQGFTLVLSGVTTSQVYEGGSIEFVTGLGNGGTLSGIGTTITGADPFTYVIQNVSYVGPDGRGTVDILRSQLTTVAAGHTGGIKVMKNLPFTSSTTTLTSAVGAGDTAIPVNSTGGFQQGGYILSPNGELMLINSFTGGNQIDVSRASEGTTASSVSSGAAITAIGFPNILTPQTFKDFTGVSTQMRVTSTSGFTTTNFVRIDNEIVRITKLVTDPSGTLIVVLAEEKPNPCFDEQGFKVRYLYSQVRLTGHDFLQIGTGGTSTTNWPGVPTVNPIPSSEVTEGYPGRVYYVSTDQNGNFRVGKYFRVNQATGAATLNASAFDLSGLTSLRLGSIGAQLGAQINEFAVDGTLSQNSNEKVATQAAVKTYVDNSIVKSRSFVYWIATS